MRRLWVLLALFTALAAPRPRPEVAFSRDELRKIYQHSPLQAPPPDPTNAVADSAAAALLGQHLFFDRRLSSDGRVSCATCHQPERGWSDGKPLGAEPRATRLHVPTLWNTAYNRWFFWDGRADSQWSQALQPLENPFELGSNRLRLAHVVDQDRDLRRAYEAVFGPLPELSDRRRFPLDGRPVPHVPDGAAHRAWESMSAADQDAINRVFANLGKAIAAFERRIVSRRSPFDRFAEGLRDGDPEKLRALSPPAQRGLRTFVGRGNCRLCHSGPNFTDGEFHSVGVPERASYVDYARLRGIHEVVRDPFNGIGPYSDDRSAGPVRFLPRETHQGHNQFKTPTLRNVAETAPYMHNGSFPTLEAVVRFYSTREGARFSRHHTESILRPLDLTGREVADLVAFLESLTGEPLDPALTRPPSLYHSRDSLAGHPHGAIAGGGRFVIMPWPALPPA